MAYQCLLELAGPADVLNCLNTLEPAAWAVIFIGGLFLITGGWMIGIGFKGGLAVGGFSTTMIGLMLFLAEILPFQVLLIPLITMLVGIFLLVLDANRA